MTRLPVVDGSEVVKALQRVGFVIQRQRGSHIFMKHVDGRATVVLVHKGESLGPGMLLKIMHDIELTREEFIDLLRM